ncbi:hypothetical protein AUJ66_07975 [Candidatus Desantisbacteria bacterium CG1_02_38_46]|uniref:Uncharacterized protein n=1 Tax=Candidatus Desantisbacteria bacterium CG1_02_38_46 TaxID=1817893 RepID=A0A1J4S9C1_9BACT|nr:MAG: hypothetical protein AUJ66_07975 [Candidatus Desantisbacteria bacterium CG1_02_38_46]
MGNDMSTFITYKNFKGWIKNKWDSSGHAQALAPFFTIHETASKNQEDSSLWAWAYDRAIDKCSVIVWHLTGEWSARRNITITNRKKFEQIVADEVTHLTDVFNKYNVKSPRDLGSMSQKQYKKVFLTIEESVKNISKVRHTMRIEPVLGSKVLHHFFPSIIPVYDTAMVSKEVIPLIRKKSQNQEKLKSEGWLFKEYSEKPKMKKMMEYRLYLAFAAQQIYDTKRKILNKLSQRIANWYMFHGLVPGSLISKKRSFFWRLDAKLAEYCLIGAT